MQRASCSQLLRCRTLLPARAHWISGLLHAPSKVSLQIRERERHASDGVAKKTCSTSASSRDRAMEEYLSPVQLRELDRSRTARERFRVAGVTFEGRQNLIASLHQGDAVMLEQEPENPYDPFAVAVKLLDGTKIGYIPKDINQEGTFARPVSFGHVQSVGVAESTNFYGVQIQHNPTLPPLLAEPIPLQLRGACQDLPACLPHDLWEQLEANVLTQADGRCLVSRSRLDPPEVLPVWRSDEAAQKIVLDGLTCLAPQLRRAQDELLREGPLDREAGLIFQAINGWILDELHCYRTRQQTVAKSRSHGHWKLDLQWLFNFGVPTPDELVPFL